MKALEFARMLSGVKQQGNQWRAQCPAHQDLKSSLLFRDGEETLLVRCQEGCTKEAICAALQKDPKTIFPKKITNLQQNAWSIKDLWGRTVAIHKCWEFTLGKKESSWETPEGKIGLLSYQVENLPLYGSQKIPSFDKSRWIYLCEGESATDALLALGGQALGTVTGAMSLPSKDSFELLRGYRVALWPSNDESGRDHMQRAKKILKDVVRELITLDTRDLPPKGSAVQWAEEMLQTSLTKVGLRELLQQEEIPGLPREMLFSIAPKQEAKLKTRTLQELLGMELSAPEPLLGQWLTRNSLGLVYGETRAGRTWFCLEVARALTTGKSSLEWEASRRCSTLLVDSETPLITLQGQLRQFFMFTGEQPSEHSGEHLQILSLHDPDNQTVFLDLGTQEGQSELRKQLVGIEVLIINGTPSWLFRSDSESFTEWLAELRRTGLGILLAKSVAQPSFVGEDWFDYRIRVEPNESKLPEGSLYKAMFQHANYENAGCSTQSGHPKGKRQAIFQLKEKGLKVNEIARQLQIAKSYVSRVLSLQIKNKK